MACCLKALGSFKTLVSTHPTTQCHSPDDHHCDHLTGILGQLLDTEERDPSTQWPAVQTLVQNSCCCIPETTGSSMTSCRLSAGCTAQLILKNFSHFVSAFPFPFNLHVLYFSVDSLLILPFLYNAKFPLFIHKFNFLMSYIYDWQTLSPSFFIGVAPFIPRPSA